MKRKKPFRKLTLSHFLSIEINNIHTSASNSNYIKQYSYKNDFYSCFLVLFLCFDNFDYYKLL